MKRFTLGAVAAWASFGQPAAAEVTLLAYYPHRLELVDAFSDISGNGGHICIAHNDDWGDEFCLDAAPSPLPMPFAFPARCRAADQRVPTWLDVSSWVPIDGGVYERIVTPLFVDDELVRETVEDCDWLTLQLKTVGGQIPGTGNHDPDFLFWGAYERIDPLVLTLPDVNAPLHVPRIEFVDAVESMHPSANWRALGASGQVWGQIALTCQLLVYDKADPSLLQLWAVALWAHAGLEATDSYGPYLLDRLGLPAIVSPSDRRLVEFLDRVGDLFPSGPVGSISTSWGRVKGQFE